MTDEHGAAILEQLRVLNEKLGSTSVSSVQIATSTRGYDIQVKCYAGSDVRSAGDAAVSEYLRVRQEIEARLMGGAA